MSTNTTPQPRLADLEYGPSTGIPILLIHGWTLNGAGEAYDFEPIFNTTPAASSATSPQQQYRRIYVDLPAHGSTPSYNVQNLDDIFHHLCQFIDSHLGNARFLLAGSSCGGYLARAVAVKYAAQIDGLLLRVPMVEPWNRDLDPFQPVLADQNLVDGLSSKRKALLGNEILVQTPAYIEALESKFAKVYEPAAELANNAVLEPIRADERRYKLPSAAAGGNGQPELLSPTLIVCGRQDGTTGFRDCLRLLEVYPRSTFAVLDRAGHDLPIDQQELFAALVRDWLTRVEEWRSVHK